MWLVLKEASWMAMELLGDKTPRTWGEKRVRGVAVGLSGLNGGGVCGSWRAWDSRP